MVRRVWALPGKFMIAWCVLRNAERVCPGVEALIEAFADRKLLRPRHDLPNLVDLARAVARLCGVDLNLSSHAEDMVEAIGTSDHLVLTLADGVGVNMVEMLPEDSFLPSHLHSEILTVFPSSTSVALTSLTTAQWPSEHAVMGWWTFLPDLNGVATILQYTARSGGDLMQKGIDPERTFPVRSIWPQMKRDVLIVVPERIKDSVYSSYFNGGLGSVGYRSLSEAVGIVTEHVLDAREPTFTYLYIPRVDSVAHLHGIARPEVRHALVEVDRELARLHSEIGDKGRMVVTADHGLLDATAPERHTLRGESRDPAAHDLTALGRRASDVPANLGMGWRSDAQVLRPSLRREVRRDRPGGGDQAGDVRA